MELDATQALPLSDYDDDTDEEAKDAEKIPVAYLKIIPHRSCSEAKHPVYEGENVIGRNEESTNIYIPVKALSKQHASIIVRGENHFMYDKSSRNRSKRGKMYLTPEVRYELKDGDELTLADVKCVYEKIKPQSQESSNNANGTATTSDPARYVFEEDSDPSSDLLQPTQAFAEDGSGPIKQQKQGEQHFIEDSDEEETVTNNKGKHPVAGKASVKETPMVPKKAGFVPDSDADESGIGQTLVYEPDKDSPLGEKERERLACMATQAPGDFHSDSDTDADEDKAGADAAPTQVFTEAGDDAPTQVFQETVGEDNEATQVVQEEPVEKSEKSGKGTEETEDEKDEEEEMVIPDSQAPKEEEGPALNFQATMAFEDDYESDDEPIIPFKKQEQEEEQATQVFDSTEDKDATSADDVPTQVIGDAADDDATQVVAEADDVATQVITDEASKGPEQKKKAVKKGKKQRKVEDDATQVIDDGATQVVAEDNAPTQVLSEAGNAATQVLSEADNAATQVVSAGDGDATQVLAADEDATQVAAAVDDDATQVVDAVDDDATQAVAAADDDATQVTTEADDNAAQVVAAVDYEDDEATQVVTEEEPTPAAGPKDQTDDDDVSTQIIGEDANLATRGTADVASASKAEDATQVLPQDEDATQVVGTEETQMLDDTGVSPEDATQIFGLGDETLLFNKSRVDEDASQALDEEECSGEAETQLFESDKAPTVSSEEATQLFDTAETTKPKRATRGKKASPAKTSPVQKSKRKEDVDATQAYEETEDADMSTLRLETSGCSSIGDDLAATQAYTLQADEEDDLQATQAYGVDVDHDAPTQAVDTSEFAVPVAPPKRGRGRAKKKIQPPAADKEDTLPCEDNQETQAYEMSNEGTKDDIEATQAYSLEEDQDDTPAMEVVESSQEEEDTTSIIKIPSMLKKSPAKSALASPDTKGQRRSRVAFVEEQKEEEEPETAPSKKTTRGKTALKRQDTPALAAKKEETEKALPAGRGRRGRAAAAPDGGSASKEAVGARATRAKAEEKKPETASRPGRGKRKPVEKAAQAVESEQEEESSPKRGKGRTQKDVGKSLEISLEESPTFPGRQDKKRSREMSPEPQTEECKASPAKRGRGRPKRHVQDAENTEAAVEAGEEKHSETAQNVGAADEKDEDVPAKAAPSRKGRPARRTDVKEASDVPAVKPSTKRARAATPEPQEVEEGKPFPAKRGRGRPKAEASQNEENKQETAADVKEEVVVEDTGSQGSDTTKATRRGASKKKEETTAVERNSDVGKTGEHSTRRSVATSKPVKDANKEPVELPCHAAGKRNRARQSDIVTKSSSSVTAPTVGRGRKSMLESNAVSTNNQKKETDSQSSQTLRGRRSAVQSAKETPADVSLAVKPRGRRHTDVGTTVMHTESTISSTRGRRSAVQASKASVSHKQTSLPQVSEEETKPTRSSRGKQTAKQEDLHNTEQSSEEDNILVLKQKTKGSKMSNSAAANQGKGASESTKGAVKRSTRGKGAEGPETEESEESQQIQRGKGKQTKEPAKGPKGRPARRVLKGSSKEEESAGPEAKKEKASAETASPSKTQRDEVAPSTPSLRHKKPEKCPKVMFTGVVDKMGEKIVKDLGGELVDSIYECTHLVTDKVRRTVKFLCGLARGLLIVHPDWLEKCKAAKHFLDAKPFIMEDKENEKKFKFSLQESLQKVPEGGLLKGYKVHATKNVKPEPQQIKDIIKCAGGQYLASIPKKPASNVVVVSCPEDEAECTGAVQSGVAIVTTEFLLAGILHQEVDTELHKLIFSTRGRSKRQSTVATNAADTKKRRR